MTMEEELMYDLADRLQHIPDMKSRLHAVVEWAPEALAAQLESFRERINADIVRHLSEIEAHAREIGLPEPIISQQLDKSLQKQNAMKEETMRKMELSAAEAIHQIEALVLQELQHV